MKTDSSGKNRYKEVFLRLTECVNSLPLEERVFIRTELGNYSHDMKHYLGVISGANTLLDRNISLEDRDYQDQDREVIDMIRDSSIELNDYTDLLTEYLCKNIFIEKS